MLLRQFMNWYVFAGIGSGLPPAGGRSGVVAAASGYGYFGVALGETQYSAQEILSALGHDGQQSRTTIARCWSAIILERNKCTVKSV